MANDGILLTLVRQAIEALEYERLRSLVQVCSDSYKSRLYNHLETEKEKSIFEVVCL